MTPSKPNDPTRLLVLLAIITAAILLLAAICKMIVLSIAAFCSQLCLLMYLFFFLKQKGKMIAGGLSKVSGLSSVDVGDHLSAIIHKEIEAEYLIEKLIEGGDQFELKVLDRDRGIGRALWALKEKLTTLKAEDVRRNWTQEGLARFADLLRFGNSLEELCDKVLRSLVQYVGASQGALFVAEQGEGERHLTLKACYAYNKTKYIEKKIFPGDGMIGQCMLSKEEIYLKSVPADYINITSGLGEALPRTVLIIPLVFNKECHGVIELASFSHIENYQIEFIKKLSENIAAEIASRCSALNTEQLLAESKRLSDELSAQDEELRQNMEELNATQEQMERKQAELNSVFSAINNTVASIEFDMNGKVLQANSIFLQVAGYTDTEICKINYKALLPAEERNKSQHDMMWTNLQAGRFFAGEIKLVDKNRNELWLSGTFNPIFNALLEPCKVIMIAQFTGQEKAKIADLTGTLAAIKLALPYLELDREFKCKSANDKFLKLFNLKRVALKDLNFMSLLDRNHDTEVSRLIASNLDGPIEGDFCYKGSGTSSYIHTVVCPIKDAQGKLSKSVVILTPAVTGKEHSLLIA